MKYFALLHKRTNDVIALMFHEEKTSQTGILNHIMSFPSKSRDMGFNKAIVDDVCHYQLPSLNDLILTDHNGATQYEIIPIEKVYHSNLLSDKSWGDFYQIDSHIFKTNDKRYIASVYVTDYKSHRVSPSYNNIRLCDDASHAIETLDKLHERF